MRLAIPVVLITTSFFFGAKASGSAKGALPKSFISACELNFPKSDINIELHTGKVTENHKETIRSLTALARKSNVMHTGKDFVLGLTTSELSWDVSAQFKSLQLNGSDIHCARPEIKIQLDFQSHVVHMAKELPPGSCEYNFVHEHEYKHVKINNENAKQYVQDIITTFNKRFPNKILYGSGEEVKKEMQRTMDKDWLPFIKKATQKMETTGKQRHNAIDTPEEYAKSHTVCSGKISSLVRASQKK